MLNCAVHPSVWVWEPRPKPSTTGRAIGGGGQAAKTHPAPASAEKKPHDSGLVTMKGSDSAGAGCPNGKCGIKLFRRRR
jgi:hypothetical protein